MRPGPPVTELVDALAAKYHLGHPAIDRQHREMFRIAAMADEGSDPGRLLDALLAYAGFHFAAEERIAEAAGVLAEDHAHAHGRLTAQLVVMRRNPRLHVVNARRLIARWIAHHIDHEDRELVGAIGVGERMHGRAWMAGRRYQ